MICCIRTKLPLYDEENSGNINALYKNNRDTFFKSFGVNQILNSIAALKDRIKIVDPRFKTVKGPNLKSVPGVLAAFLLFGCFCRLLSDTKLAKYIIQLIFICDFTSYLTEIMQATTNI